MYSDCLLCARAVECIRPTRCYVVVTISLLLLTTAVRIYMSYIKYTSIIIICYNLYLCCIMLKYYNNIIIFKNI